VVLFFIFLGAILFNIYISPGKLAAQSDVHDRAAVLQFRGDGNAISCFVFVQNYSEGTSFSHETL
jgi:hypothetical protein